jgi:predicted ATPase
MRLAVPILVPLLILVLVGPSFADPADIETGDERATFNRQGTPLVEKPRPLSKLVKRLPYGSKLRVEEVSGRWIRVTEIDVESEAKAGWVKASETVDPFALTQGGQFRRSSTGTGEVSRRDAAAAARQFSPTTEAAHRQASTAQIRAAYQLLDEVLEATKPTLEEIMKFVGEGRLGRPDGDETETPSPQPAQMPPLPQPDEGAGG